MSTTDYPAPGLKLFDWPVTAVEYERPRSAFAQEIADEHGVLCHVQLADGVIATTVSSNLKLVAA